MSTTLIVRSLEATDWRVYRALRLGALEDSPDAFSTVLSERQDESDEFWSSILAGSGESPLDLPLVAEVNGLAVGLCWGKIETREPELAQLYQMWVAPDGRCVGAGRALLDRVIDWARAQSAGRLELDVTCGDTPARRLYERAGFRPLGSPEPLRQASEIRVQPMQLDLRAR